MSKLKKNDRVQVLSGVERGKQGKVLHIIPDKERAIVEGLRLLKVHSRATRDNPKGGVIQREGALPLSNLMLVCPRCNKPTRVGFTILADRTKKRQCKKCQEIIE